MSLTFSLLNSSIKLTSSSLTTGLSRSCSRPFLTPAKFPLEESSLANF